MSYTEIFESYYSDGGKEWFDRSLSTDSKNAFLVIQFFASCKGFDWWFDPIDDETKNDLFEKLVERLKTLRVQHPTPEAK